jgi:uncharacterized protein (DUF1015 family)
VARVLPFRALRYHPRFASRMEALVAPPYDVIGEAERLRYVAAHPRNVVRLILPGEAGLAEDGSFYAGAAALLGQWRKDGTVREEPRPALYPYRQTYTGPDGVRISRLGFFGALALESTAGAGALPHERTLEGPRRDRTRLLAACRVNLSPIFLLHPDDLGEVGACLAEAVAAPPEIRFTDGGGVLNELWTLSDPAPLARIGRGMESDWTLIADGHHRYESALAVMQEHPGEEGARRVLAFFCSLRDPGFRILPIHRLVRLRKENGAGDLRSLLQDRLAWEPLPGLSPREVVFRLREAGQGSFGVLLRDGPPILLKLDRRGTGSGTSEFPESLDTVALQREILEKAMGISREAVAGGAVDYTADPEEAGRKVSSGEASVAFLLNPLPVEDVVRAAREGVRLPQKSTFFFPKIPTGLVFRPF